MSDAWETVRASFSEEAREGLDELDQCLLSLEATPEDQNLVHRAFRAIHSLKGSAATLSFGGCADFAHHLESLLISVRDGKLQIEPMLIDLCLRSSDQLRGMLGDSQLMEGTRSDSAVAELVAELQVFSAAPGMAAVKARADGLSEECTYAITFRPHPGFFGLGADPALVLEELAGLGQLSVRGEWERLPQLADLNAEECWLGWICSLTTGAPPQAIREIFELCEDIAEVSIERQDLKFDPQVLLDYRREALEHLDSIQQALLQLETSPHDQQAREGLLRDFHSLKGASGLLLSSANQLPGPNHPVLWIRDGAHQAESSLQEGQLDPDALLAFSDSARQAVLRLLEVAPVQATVASAVSSAGPTTVRVEQARLDQLLRVVGEAMMTHGSLQSMAVNGQLVALPESAARFKEVLGELRRTGRELHERVMSLRMLPVRTVFQKLPRLVRDLARSLDKEIRLVMEGEAIELDRSILERIADPLVHLVRNSADHGLETPSERIAAGRQSQGCITLAAVHEATTVVIHVRDDGRGARPDEIARSRRRVGYLRY